MCDKLREYKIIKPFKVYEYDLKNYTYIVDLYKENEYIEYPLTIEGELNEDLPHLFQRVFH